MMILKLAIGYIKKNKKWSISTYLSTVIWVALLTAISTFGTSYNMMVRKTIEYYDGVHHFTSYNLNDNQIKTLQQNDEVDMVSVVNVVSYAKVPEVEILNQQKPYFKLLGSKPEDYKKLGYTITSGRPATKPNEIVISNSVLSYTTKEIELGDIITIEKGVRLYEEKPYMQSPLKTSGIEEKYKEEKYYKPKVLETFKVEKKQQYRVVGFILDSPRIEQYDDAGFQAIVNESIDHSPFNIVQMKLKNVTARSVLRMQAVAKEHQIQIYPNQSISTYFTGFSNLQDSVFFQTTIATVLVGSFVMIAALLVIYQSFLMISSQLATQLGILASIGATRKQRQLMIITIAIMLVIGAIPLGILLGFLSAKLILTSFLDVVNSTGLPNLVSVEVSPFVLLLICSLILLSTILVTYVPSYRINKLTAIEAIKQNKQSNQKIGASRIPRWIKKIESQLAIRNFLRNKGHYIAVIISLVTSVVLIVSVASAIDITKRFEDKVNRDVSYSLNDNKLTDNTAIRIVMKTRNKSGITNAGLWKEFSLDIVAFSDQLTLEYQKVLQNQQVNELFFQIWILDDVSMTKFLQPKLNTKVTDKVILIDQVSMNYFVNDIRHNYSGSVFNLKKDDYLKLKIMNTNESTGSIKIDRVIEPSGLGLQFKNPTIIISKSYSIYTKNPLIREMVLDQQNQFTSNHMIFANGSNNSLVEKQLVESIKEVTNYNPANLVNEIESSFAYYRQQKFVSITVYSLVIAVIAIALINIFNTISTNLKVRQREFSILRSCGMSPDSILKMIVLEAMIYGGITTILSIPLSYFVAKLLQRTLFWEFETNVFSFQMTVLVALLVFIVVILVSFAYSFKTMKKEPIVQSIVV